MEIKFTVITVVMNGGKVIRKTLESVLNQSLSPYEYLVIDGKSTDETVNIVKSYENRFAEKNIHLHILSEKDTGIYNAMNKGIVLAKGDFISYLNAGDWYEPDALENIQAFYDQSPFELTYGGLNYIRPDGSIVIKMSKLDWFPVSSRHWNHPSMFLKREIYARYGFDESFRAYADFNLYLKLRKDGTCIQVIPKVITNFSADGVSTNTDFKQILKRAKEKYHAYRQNGYSRLYWMESYGWEIFKGIYFSLFKK